MKQYIAVKYWDFTNRITSEAKFYPEHGLWEYSLPWQSGDEGTWDWKKLGEAGQALQAHCRDYGDVLLRRAEAVSEEARAAAVDCAPEHKASFRLYEMAFYDDAAEGKCSRVVRSVGEFTAWLEVEAEND